MGGNGNGSGNGDGGQAQTVGLPHLEGLFLGLAAVLGAASAALSLWLAPGRSGDSAALLAAAGSLAFALSTYGFARAVLGLAPAVAAAVTGTLALHPVIIRHAAAQAPHAWIAAIAAGALVAARWAEHRRQTREPLAPPAGGSPWLALGPAALLLAGWGLWLAWDVGPFPGFRQGLGPPAARHALWQGLGHVLPGWLVPQVFLAGYPLGPQEAALRQRLPETVVAVWGFLVAWSAVVPLWRLRAAPSVATRAAAWFALLVLALGLGLGAAEPARGWDLVATALWPAAPAYVGSIWLWKAGEHRFERAAAERYKGYVALAWLALVALFCPVALGPLREFLASVT